MQQNLTRGRDFMKKLRWSIPIVIISIITIIATLWLTGITPMEIAKISITNYVKKNFPEMQLEFVDVEYSHAHGEYLIKFKNLNEKVYSCIIGPKLFPISIGQGITILESEYAQNYK